jgi:Alcohol dehydrogenase, class IV
MRGGGGGAHPAAIVYEPRLTLGLSVETTVGTSMNALAHCAEALYAEGHNPYADGHALAGARLVSEWLPRVVAAPDDLEARTELLRGACHAGAALAASMLALAHAMAQAVGGRYGLPHGTLNGITLPPRFASTPCTRRRRCGASARRSAPRKIRPAGSRSWPGSPGQRD